uniref:Uncharacterized protein n=1 Tax=Oryza brachyantha TaxID=4533 RepID=J3MKC4_ORYBR
MTIFGSLFAHLVTHYFIYQLKYLVYSNSISINHLYFKSMTIRTHMSASLFSSPLPLPFPFPLSFPFPFSFSFSRLRQAAYGGAGGGAAQARPAMAARCGMALRAAAGANCGNLTGSMTASYGTCLAPSSPKTSLHLTSGFPETMAEWSPARRLARSESPPPPPSFPLLSFLSSAVGAATAATRATSSPTSACRISSARA